MLPGRRGDRARDDDLKALVTRLLSVAIANAQARDVLLA
jgi:hypothetical protein